MADVTLTVSLDEALVLMEHSYETMNRYLAGSELAENAKCYREWRGLYDKLRAQVVGQKHQLTVEELLGMEIDVDVYDNVCEELAIAFCGPVELTDAGRERFADALTLHVELTSACAIVDVDGEDGVWQKKLGAAKRLFNAAAGYCSTTSYDRWFKEG